MRKSREQELNEITRRRLAVLAAEARWAMMSPRLPNWRETVEAIRDEMRSLDVK